MDQEGVREHTGQRRARHPVLRGRVPGAGPGRGRGASFTYFPFTDPLPTPVGNDPYAAQRMEEDASPSASTPSAIVNVFENEKAEIADSPWEKRSDGREGHDSEELTRSYHRN